MKNKAYILLTFCFLCCFTASAQMTNRQKMIAVILGQHKVKPAHSYQSQVPTSPFCSVLSTSLNPIPKYSLPKGNVICRFEDYVQMHTPMKLNIGVGGQ